MIIVCGGLADSVTELVCARLEDCKYPYRLLDLGTFPSPFELKWQWDGSTPNGYIGTADWKVDVNEISSVYVRYLGAEGRMARAELDNAEAMFAEHDTTLMAFFEDVRCLVVNRLAGGISNCSKPYQLLLAQHAGFSVPDTLVTNDENAVREFYEANNGEIIFKSLSGVRSIVRNVDDQMLDRLGLLANGPTQFQAFIPGNNIRVHVVGDELFPTRIRSEAVDYRYAARAEKSVEMEAAELPADVAESCIRISRDLGLSLTGIDLKETPEGEFYCLEINPCPGFIYYEKHTGQPISEALANLLHRGH